MRETQAYIERIKRVNRSVQRLELAVDPALAELKAGQALLVRAVDSNYDAPLWHPYMRALWFPVERGASHMLAFELPADAPYTPGQLLSLLGPVGQPLRFRHKLRSLLLIAYDSLPSPLLMILPAALKRGISLTLVLMGSAREYSTQHLPSEVEIFRADDDLAWPDMVMTVGWADQIVVVACQRQEDSRFARVRQLIERRRKDIPAQLLFGIWQRALPCGVGACHACMLREHGEYKLQCVHGPAFDLTAMG